MKLIVGLGNPGPEYTQTKHNIGFMVLDYIVSTGDYGPWIYEKKRQSVLIELSNNKLTGLKSDKLLFLKPQTFMNRSGDAVVPFAKFYNISPADILVLQDDIDLAPGIVKYKVGGGHAGHNGLRDIIAKLGNPDFHRIRIGIGRPVSKEQVSDYVLSSFAPADKVLIDKQLETIKQFVNDFLAT